jgi:hypothetical protein
MLIRQDQNLKNIFVADTSFLYGLCKYKKKKIKKKIKTGFNGQVGDGLLILETHYFSDICKRRTGQPYCC